MQEYLSLLQSSVEQLGIWFIIPFLVLENIPIVGLFAPGLTVLVLSGFFYELLTGSYFTLFLVCWFTIFLADTTWFGIGYWGQQKTSWLRALAAKSPNVNELINRQPWWALMNYQFIPYFRMFLPFALGMYRFSPVRWVVMCLIGSALYVAIFLGIGVLGVTVLGGIAEIDMITNNVNRILAVGAVLYGIYLVRKYHQLNQRSE